MKPIFVFLEAKYFKLLFAENAHAEDKFQKPTQSGGKNAFLTILLSA